MGSSSTDADHRTLIRRAEAVADLSQRALETEDLDGLLGEAAAAVTATLDVEYCTVFELEPDGTEAVLRGGAGCPEDRIGTATLPADRTSHVGAALRGDEPVVVDDFRDGSGFASEPHTDRDVGSAVAVRVGSTDDPWGVLSAYGPEQRPVTDSDVDFLGRVADVLASAIENARTRRELERTERRFEAIFEDPNILVGLLEPDGTVVDINGTAMEYVDADLADVSGEPFWETPWWGEGDETRADVRRWTERAASGEYVNFEADLTRPNGERYTLNGAFRPVTNDAGDVVSIIVSDRDVTERKERERQLEESEQRYRTLVEHFPNGAVALVDGDLRYRTVGGNPADVADVTTSEIEGEPVREALPPGLADELVPRYEAALEGESSAFETTSNGRVYDFQVVPVRDDDGEAFAALGMSQDVTERRAYERELEDAKSRFEAATEAGAVGTWEWHVPEDRMVVSTTFAETFGIDPEPAREGVSLDRFVEAIHEDDRDRVERKIDDALDSCGEYEAEYRVRNAAGEIRWVVARGRVECDEDGEPVRFPGALTDITERKRAELELERTNEQLESLIEILPVGVVVAEADGRMIQVNDAAREIWGGDVFDTDSVEEYEKYPVWDVDSGERVDPEAMTLARVLDGEEVSDPDIYEIEAADGKRRIIRVAGMPTRDEHGEVTRGVATITDITERREYQRKLEESEQRYRTLVENFPNGAVGLFDETLEYTVVGGQLLDDVGVTTADRVGNSVYDIYPDDIVEELEPYFRAALEGESNSFEIEFYDRYLHANTLPVRNAADEIFAGMVVVQDVTERQEYQRRLEESNERLERFAYAASHDLQEPLRMVTSYLQLLESRYGDAFDEDGREFLEFAVDGADRMREMIDGLLEYSRVETRGDPFEPTDLNAILENVLADLQFRIEESDAEITVEDLPRVEGDASQLRQVFQNLLSNAITYSGDEPPKVHVGARRRGGEWELSVEDQGIGIDPEDQERVFTIFDRLHSREEYEGTGIGLALCERIVERHGGTIRVESEPGEGTTFSFTIPASRE